MDHVRRLQDAGDHGDCAQIMAMVHSTLNQYPSSNMGNTGAPRCSNLGASSDESMSDTEDGHEGVSLADTLPLPATEGSSRNPPPSGLWTLDQRYIARRKRMRTAVRATEEPREKWIRSTRELEANLGVGGRHNPGLFMKGSFGTRGVEEHSRAIKEGLSLPFFLACDTRACARDGSR